jgi:hypothetical protein
LSASICANTALLSWSTRSGAEPYCTVIVYCWRGTRDELALTPTE